MRVQLWTLILLALGARISVAQPPVSSNSVHYVATDPSGACGYSFMTINKVTKNQMGCVAGVWTSINGGGSPGSGTVTSVATNTTLTGGPITTTGTLGIATSAALPGSPTTTTQALGDNSSKVATDSFVQAALSVFNPGLAMAAATTAVLSNTPTYSNGTAGVGATLTAGSNGALTIDGYSVLLNDPVLVNNQASSFQNGVYDLTTLGDGSNAYVLTRDTAFNTAANINAAGSLPILNGSVNNNKIAILNNAITTIGTDAITYALGAPPTTVAPHIVAFNITGGGAVITTGATNNFYQTAAGSTSGIYQVTTTGSASGGGTCSITFDVWIHASGTNPTSGNKISASAPATMTSSQNAIQTVSTGSPNLSTWTRSVPPGAVWSGAVASVTACVSATVQVFYR